MENLHVLLVDDDKLSLDTMGIILEMDGFRVTYTSNWQHALETVVTEEVGPSPIDLLVIDLEMDTVSGIHFLSELKKRGYHLPVMVITGFASRKTLVELMRQGVADYLDKPIQVDEFRSRVKNMVAAIPPREKKKYFHE